MSNYPPLDPANTRLALRPEIRFTRRETAGKSFYLVEDPVHRSFFHLGAREKVLASYFDGTRTIYDALKRANAKLGKKALSPEEALRIAHWLTQTKLARPVEESRGQATGPWRAPPRPRRMLHPLFVTVTLLNPDRLLSRLLPATSWMFTPAAFVGWLAILLAGIVALGIQWRRFSQPWHEILAPGNWLFLMATWCGLKIVHELAHGLVCKRYGGSVPKAGLAFILFSPIAFVDVTSSWRFPSRWRRIFTAAAGMYAELLIAAAAALVWASSGEGLAAQCCHRVVVMAGVSTLLFNANFLMRFDGYYILTDLLNIRNLYPAGQEYLRWTGRRFLLGLPEAPPPLDGPQRILVPVYGIASFLWRIVFYLGVICLSATMFHGAGIVLAIFSTLVWFGLPALRFVRQRLLGSAAVRPCWRRLALLSGGAAATIACLWQLPWPGGVTAPGVVAYASATAVRAESTGVVAAVYVEAGQWVEPGDELLRIDNPELQREAADAALAVEASILRARMLHQDGQIAAARTERENRASLVRRRDELQHQVESLCVLAPTSGRVLGRRLQSLPGVYVPLGSLLLTLGREDQKEVRLSIEQGDEALFRQALDQPVRTRIRGREQTLQSGRLARVEPKASRLLIHSALASVNGGPLSIVAADREAAPAGDEGAIRLATPRFAAAAPLAPEEARELHAGELAKVRLTSSGATVGRELARRIKQFIDQRSQTSL